MLNRKDSPIEDMEIEDFLKNRPVELMGYIAALEKALGRKADIKMIPLQPGDVPGTYADVTDLVE